MMLRSLTVLVVVAIFLSGCAQTQQTRTAEKSGFLEDYAMLKPGEDKTEGQLVYRNPDANWKSYDKVMIDPVTVWLGKEDSQLREVPAENRQRLANDLWSKLNESLSADYAIVHHPGPGVLRIQAAITEAGQSSVVMDTITSLHPGTRLVTGGVGMARGGRPGFVGQASLEAKATDAQTGTLLAAVVDQRAGTKSPMGATNSWNDVEEAFAFWAKQLRYRLCVERGGASCVEPEA